MRIYCLCTHARTRHKQAFGEPHTGPCRDCDCTELRTHEEGSTNELPSMQKASKGELGELAIKALRRRLENAIAGICYVCGCTDDNACADGCEWKDVDLCSTPACLQLDEVVR